MSVKTSARAWKAYLKGSDKTMLLALADSANDDGVCWRNYDTLADQVCVSKRQAIRIIDRLSKTEHLMKFENAGRGNSNLYFITTGLEQDAIDKVLKRHDLTAIKGDTYVTVLDGEKVTSGAEKVTSGAIKGDTGVTRTNYEPKKEPKDITNSGEISPLLPDNDKSRLLFQMLGVEFAAKGRNKPKKFPSMACKRKFDARADFLNGNTEAAINRALEKGILSVSGVVDFIAKWNPGRVHDNGTHIRNDKPVKKSGRSLDEQPTFDPYTGQTIPANT